MGLDDWLTGYRVRSAGVRSRRAVSSVVWGRASDWPSGVRCVMGGRLHSLRERCESEEIALTRTILREGKT